MEIPALDFPIHFRAAKVTPKLPTYPSPIFRILGNSIREFAVFSIFFGTSCPLLPPPQY